MDEVPPVRKSGIMMYFSERLTATIARSACILALAVAFAGTARAQFPQVAARAYYGFATSYSLRFAYIFGPASGGGIGLRLNPNLSVLASFSIVRIGLDRGYLSSQHSDLWENPVDVRSFDDNTGRISTVSADLIYRVEDEPDAVSWDFIGGLAYFNTMEYQVDITSVRGSRRLDERSGSSAGIVAGLGFDWPVFGSVVAVVGEGRFGAGVIGTGGFTPYYFTWRGGLELNLR